MLCLFCSFACVVENVARFCLFSLSFLLGVAVLFVVLLVCLYFLRGCVGCCVRG